MIKTDMGPEVTHNGDLVLIQIKRTEGNRKTEETTWAKPLSEDLYEIEGPLHLITGLSSGDIVKAVALGDDSIPCVLEVVRRTGHQTIHVVFSDSVPILDQQNILEALEKLNTTHQMLFDRFYTIEVNPQGEYQAACDYLKSLTLEGFLKYEPDVDMNALIRFRFQGSD